MRPLRRALPSATATLALAAVLFANAPALAQDMPEAVRKDLWCGIAFTIIAREAPGDASAEQKALAARFEDGGAMLTDRAKAALLERGYSDLQLAALIEGLEADVEAQVNSAENDDEYSFEECQALLVQ